MYAFWEVVASNAVVATALAVGALLLGRIWKNAAAVHVLWVVVLLKLFTPPLVTAELPSALTFLPPAAGAGSQGKALDSPALHEAGQTAPAAVTNPRGAVAAGNQQHTPRDRPTETAGHKPWSLSTILAAIWACGACGSALISAVRIRRFADGLRDFEAAPPAIRTMVAQLSGRLGLRREPDVLMTSRALPPLVWSLGTSPRVILPSELFARLSGEAQGTILAHELAHIRRGDHLVRLLELAATTVFWWHPVVWLAGRQLRELEEQCCDGRVLELLPHQPRTYAVALVDTLEFLSGRTCPPVPLRTAIHPTLSLSRRIHMLTQRRTNRLGALSAALVAGLVTLPLAVAFAVGPEQAVKAAPEGQQPAGAQAAVLRGRVTDGSGAPLADVRVRVAIPAADMRFIVDGAHHKQLETRSDAKGDYRLELPGITGRTPISIDATKPGHRRYSGTSGAGGDKRRLEVEPGMATEAPLLTLDPTRHLSGIVVNEQGQPIPAVQIWANVVSPRATHGIEVIESSPDGMFELFNYPVEPLAIENEAAKGVLSFSHPDYIDLKFGDVGSLEPNRREVLRIVLETGHKVTGTVFDVAGKPVPNAMVKAVLEDGGNRKATLTDANGGFALRGLGGRPTKLGVRALDIKQMVDLPMAMDGDKNGLEVRLRTMSLPADLKKHAVLGLQLADVSPELKSAYDLYQDRGALILDAGKDSDRLQIGRLAEGYSFWMVGDTRIGSVREFVNQILAETAGEVADEYSVRVVYSFSTPGFEGTNTQYLRLTKDDLKQLRAVTDRLTTEPR